MRRLLAGLVAGCVLGSVGTALAGTAWTSGGTTYRCTGSNVSVFCKETNWRTGYEVAIYPGAVSVSFGSKLIYHCNRKKRPQSNCVSYTR